jgi:hypothetical protein
VAICSLDDPVKRGIAAVMGWLDPAFKTVKPHGSPQVFVEATRAGAEVRGAVHHGELSNRSTRKAAAKKVNTRLSRRASRVRANAG